jgi:hypothetical protein
VALAFGEIEAIGVIRDRTGVMRTIYRRSGKRAFRSPSA